MRLLSAVFQELDFLGRTLATENRIAMREPSEATNDMQMFLGPFMHALRWRKYFQFLHQCRAQFLIGERFTVLKRQIDKLAFDRQ